MTDGIVMRWLCGSRVGGCTSGAVYHEGEILDVLVQRRRNQRAALKLIYGLLRKQGFAPRLVVSDKLRSYGAAFQDLHLACRHEQGCRRIIGPKTRARSCDGESASCSASSRQSFLNMHRRPQHVQPSTPSDLPEDAADLRAEAAAQWLDAAAAVCD
jgi:transposase-like protein